MADDVKTLSRLKRLVWGRNPRRTVIRGLVLVAVTFIIFRFVLLPVRISGGSMAPTYRDGRINFINRLAYEWRKPQRGDVVGVKMAGTRVLLLKRIIGLPGETVAIEQGVVHINGQPLAEPYVKHRAPWQLTPRTLGPNEYLFIGDNRGMPQEAHEFGIGEAGKIAGKALW